MKEIDAMNDIVTDRAETLEERVSRFDALGLPGQPQMMHMGTSYLVHDLWQEVKRLREVPAAGEAPTPAGAPPEDDGWQWGIVEIMGFRKHSGRVREEERFGAKMLRIDIPLKGDAAANGWETHYYGGASVFSFTPATEAVVIKLNKPYEPAAPYRIADHSSENSGEDDLFDEGDENDDQD